MFIHTHVSMGNFIPTKRTFHVSYSWYKPDDARHLMDFVEFECGAKVAVDWLSEEHNAQPHRVQLQRIIDAIRTSDVIVLSFEGMENRMWASTYDQLSVAISVPNTPIVVYDPDKKTRVNKNLSCEANVPLPKTHLFGHALCCYDLSRVFWIDNETEFKEKLKELAK